jgi:hypothetical protein
MVHRHGEESAPGKRVTADLARAVASAIFDCFVLTQTLQYIFLKSSPFAQRKAT